MFELNSFEILKMFIDDNNLKKNSINHVKNKINKFYDINGDRDDIEYDSIVLNQILADLFKLNAQNVKMVSDKIIRMNFHIGRRQKNILFKYYNYQNPDDLEKFLTELKKDNPILDEKKDDIIKLVKEHNNVNYNEAQEKFKEMWEIAEKEKDNKKIGEYLFGIFSRVYEYYNNQQINLLELFQYNKKFIRGDLNSRSIQELKDFCEENKESNENTVELFYNKYIELLKIELQEDSIKGKLEPIMNHEKIDAQLEKESFIHDRGYDLSILNTEEYNAVYLTLNQEIFDLFKNEEEFYNYALNAIIQSYRLLENNKVFAIEIDNIYSNEKNIKWDLYSYLSIFAENFIKTKEDKQFFKPENLCLDMFDFYSITLKENTDVKKLKNNIKKFYKGKISIGKVYELIETEMTIKEFKSFIEQWQYVYYGFSFQDCLILQNKEINQCNSLNMKNHNQILLLFYKYRMDQRKIPCPVCGGLNVSGNSYPEIGHRSWECKNLICSKRSKSNRGKRYSFKTNYMQFNATNLKENNLISKEFISKWRKDIIAIDSIKDAYEMFIKYFSFENEKVLFINSNKAVFEFNELQRNIKLISLIKDNEMAESNLDLNIKDSIYLFNDYFENGDYVNRFIQEKKVLSNEEYKNKISDLLKSKNSLIKLINGDSFNILNNTPDNVISSAVTSPPYYNARSYSQWPNLYLYLIDMYNIIKSLKHTLKDGGIFLYNIGDINGNENTIVTSHMGTKKLILGAYSILLFKKVGFELIDNIIWDKGEPQSNRSTNDGNLTPHYQKPINVYEHMFIFKKKEDHINKDLKEDLWESNVVPFTPVIKINSKGENTLGHTAPYPSDIPDFVARNFTTKKEDILLDPFSGSGTSVISADSNKNIGLGLELSDEYIHLSEDLIKEKNKNFETIKI